MAPGSWRSFPRFPSPTASVPIATRRVQRQAMTPVADALVIGGGPAGAASAIALAHIGWQVLLVEQSAYPRQKVCGECVSAGALELIDELGVGEEFRSLSGPELRRVGWMD